MAQQQESRRHRVETITCSVRPNRDQREREGVRASAPEGEVFGCSRIANVRSELLEERGDGGGWNGKTSGYCFEGSSFSIVVLERRPSAVAYGVNVSSPGLYGRRP